MRTERTIQGAACDSGQAGKGNKGGGREGRYVKDGVTSCGELVEGEVEAVRRAGLGGGDFEAGAADRAVPGCFCFHREEDSEQTQTEGQNRAVETAGSQETDHEVILASRSSGAGEGAATGQERRSGFMDWPMGDRRT